MIHDEVGVKNLKIPRSKASYGVPTSRMRVTFDCKEIVSSYSEVYTRQGTVAHYSVQLFEDDGASFKM